MTRSKTLIVPAPYSDTVLDCTGIRNHLKSIDRRLQEILEEFGFYVKVSSKLIINKDNAVLSGNKTIRDFIQGNADDGILHEEQIITVVDILSRILGPEGNKNIICMSPTQSGKGNMMNAMHFIGPLVYVLTGGKSKICPINLLTNRKSNEEQAINAFNEFLAVYGDIEFTTAEHSITLNAWLKKSPAYNKAGRSTKSATINNFHVNIVADVLSEQTYLTGLFYRRVKKFMRVVDGICKKALAKDYHIVFIIDEPDYGAHKDGIQAQMLKTMQQRFKSERYPHIICAFSATPWELIGLKCFTKVYGRLGPTYCGFPYFNGEWLVDPSKINIKPPECHSFTSFAKLSGIKGFQNINRTLYDNQDIFEKKAEEVLNYTNSYTKYRSDVHRWIRDGIHWCLLKQNPKNGRGLALRLLNRNGNEILGIIKSMQLDSSIKVLHYWGADATSRSVKKFIRANITDSTQRFVIVLTGSGRRADVFPSFVTYFFDFTQKPSNLTALFQGLLGRACGYGKNSMCIMSDNAMEMVERFIQTKGRALDKASAHSIRDVITRRREHASSYYLDYDTAKKDRNVFRWWIDLHNAVNDAIPKNASGPNQRKRGTSRIYENAQVVFSAIEKLAYTNGRTAGIPLKLMRPGDPMVPGRGKIDIDKKDPFSGRIGIRLKDTESKEKGRYRLLKNNVKDRKGMIEPQVWVSQRQPGEDWNVSAIILPLAKLITLPTEVGNPVADPEKAYWAEYQSAGERKNAFMLKDKISNVRT